MGALLGFFLNMLVYGTAGCASGPGSGLLLGPARACGLDWRGSSLGLSVGVCSSFAEFCSDLSSGSVCSESSRPGLSSGLSCDRGLPSGERKTSPSDSSVSSSDVFVSVASCGSFCGGPSVPGSVSSSGSWLGMNRYPYSVRGVIRYLCSV